MDNISIAGDSVVFERETANIVRTNGATAEFKTVAGLDQNLLLQDNGSDLRHPKPLHIYSVQWMASITLSPLSPQNGIEAFLEDLAERFFRVYLAQLSSCSQICTANVRTSHTVLSLLSC